MLIVNYMHQIDLKLDH